MAVTSRRNLIYAHVNAEINPIRHLLALVGARHIVHVSRIRVNVTFTESRVQCREGGKQPLSSKRFADDCMCLTLGNLGFVCVSFRSLRYTIWNLRHHFSLWKRKKERKKERSSGVCRTALPHRLADGVYGLRSMIAQHLAFSVIF